MIILSVGSYCNKQDKPEFLSRLQKEKPFLEIGFHPSRHLKADSLYKCSLDLLCVLYSTFLYIKALKVLRERGTESRMTAH